MKRPIGVIIIGALLLVQGLALALVTIPLLALQGVNIFGALSSDLAQPLRQLRIGDWLALGVVALIAVGSVIASIGMLRLRPWAWLIAMTLQAVTLVELLFAYFAGQPNYVSMLLGAGIVLYLNTRSVRQAFELAQRRAGFGATGTPTSARTRDETREPGRRPTLAPQ